VPNAALLAFNASAIVNHDQDQQQGDVAQKVAVPSDEGENHASKLHLPPFLLSLTFVIAIVLLVS
jgi:hypothetical protein